MNTAMCSKMCKAYGCVVFLLTIVIQTNQHESDARYGGFDFRAAHEEAPADLQQLLDNNESLVSNLRESIYC